METFLRVAGLLGAIVTGVVYVALSIRDHTLIPETKATSHDCCLRVSIDLSHIVFG